MVVGCSVLRGQSSFVRDPNDASANDRLKISMHGGLVSFDLLLHGEAKKSDAGIGEI